MIQNLAISLSLLDFNQPTPRTSIISSFNNGKLHSEFLANIILFHCSFTYVMHLYSLPESSTRPGQVLIVSGQGFQLQFPSCKIHTKIQVSVSSCNCQVSRFKPSSRSGFQVAISKFQDSHQDPCQGFKLQFPSFKIQTNQRAYQPASQ